MLTRSSFIVGNLGYVISQGGDKKMGTYDRPLRDYLLQPTSLTGKADTRQILNALYEHTAHIHAGLGNKAVDWAWMLPEMARRGYGGYLSLEGIAEPNLETIEREIRRLRGQPLDA